MSAIGNRVDRKDEICGGNNRRYFSQRDLLSFAYSSSPK